MTIGKEIGKVSGLLECPMKLSGCIGHCPECKCRVTGSLCHGIDCKCGNEFSKLAVDNMNDLYRMAGLPVSEKK